MRTVFVLFVLSTLAFLSHAGKGPSTELSLLSAKFQSMINELGDKTVTTNHYRDELSSLLQKLQRIQSSASENRTIALDWFGATGDLVEVTPMRVVLVVSSFEGMYLNSGIGTFYSALADFLRSQGHSVTVLYTHNDYSEAAETLFFKWQANSQKRGITVARLDPLPVHVTSPLLTQRSYQVYQYLKKHQEEFDVVHFPDWEGPGYFTLLAKHQGLEFLSKVFAVGLHGPTRWVKYANQDPTLTEVSEVETDWLERSSVEMADIVITPSSDLPQWLTSQGWNLPSTDNIYLMPFLPGKEINMINKKHHEITEKKTNVRELVFFGRLEARKGLVLFADALDILAQRTETNIRQLKITFLGRSTSIDGKSASDYLASRAEKGAWPFRLHYISHKDRRSSLDYLLETDQDRLAVMPSLVDNAPYTVYECLYAHIPFVASDLPSIASLVHPNDRISALFAPTADAIATKIGGLVQDGASTVRSFLTVGDSVKSWKAFYHVVDVKVHSLPASKEVYALPKVTVCIPYYNRPHLLPMTLQSVRDQDYPAENIEVVLVDDGSTDTAAIEYVASLNEEFDQRGWKIVRTENKYLGAARNTAARSASGEFLLFLDDDNLGKPNQISTYVSVAKYTQANIVTAAHDVFRGAMLPDESADNSNIVSRSVPLGPAAAVGMFKNCFGDANFFVNRETFIASGGFTEERGVGQEDYEYFAKAVLAGQTLEAIPEVLLYYRMHDNPSEQMLYNTDPVENQVRSARPYASLLDDDVESGEVLRVLAHKRVESLTRNARAETVCNMTITSISRNSFPMLQPTPLTFTVGSPDCRVKAVRIGSFLCRNLTWSGNSSFSCVAPPIPFPSRYAVSIVYVENSSPSRTYIYVNVTRVPINVNLATLIFTFLADNGIYSLSSLYQLFGQLVRRNPTIFTTIDEDVQAASRRRTVGSLENHVLRFSLATPANESSSDLAIQLITTVLRNKNALGVLGVSVSDFVFVGKCDPLARCVCTPNFAGADCSLKSGCASGCSSNGACVDGIFGRVCNCYLGYAGRDCSFRTCPLECSGHGSCRLTPGQNGTCKCNFGYSGDACENDVPCPGNCNGFGTCRQGICLCIAGRSGDSCLNIDDNPYAKQVIEPNQATDSNQNNMSDDDAIEKGLIAATVIVGLAILVAISMVVYLIVLRRR